MAGAEQSGSGAMGKVPAAQGPAGCGEFGFFSKSLCALSVRVGEGSY